jgi:hypothetical protein
MEEELDRMLFVVNVKYVDDLVILAKKEAALQA